MCKFKFKKGFTLAELLVVVAIIAVLVAVAIPVFSAQLEKSRKAVDDANLRMALSLAQANLLSTGSIDGNGNTVGYFNPETGVIDGYDIYGASNAWDTEGYNQSTQNCFLGQNVYADFKPGQAVIMVSSNNPSDSLRAKAEWTPTMDGWMEWQGS